MKQQIDTTIVESPDQQLHDILANYPQIELAILFGSMANGRATPQSDITVVCKPIGICQGASVAPQLFRW